MCRTDPPYRPAKMSCHGNMPDPPASMTRQIYLPEIPPSPLKIPRQNMARQPPPPPPHGSANGAGGGGARSWPGPPVHLEQVLLLSHEWLHILVKHSTYIFYTERIKWSIWIYCFRRRKSCKEGVRSWSPPGPVKGRVCMIWSLQEVSRHAILTRIGYESTYNIPLYTNKYISA
jgi:hypothetical protein